MNAQTQPAALAAFPLNINLTDFIDEFGDELLESLNRSNPPRSIPAPTTFTASW